MADATGSTATVRLSAPAGEDGEAMFQASGTVIEFPGFMKATGEGRRAAAPAASSMGAGDGEAAAKRASRETDDNGSLPPMQTVTVSPRPRWRLTGTRPSRRRDTPKRRW